MTPIPMVYRTPYPWYFDPPIHGILTPPFHGILTPLPMVYWTPYPWYFDPLPMVYQTLSYGIMNPSLLAEMRGVNLRWGGSKYNDEKATPGSIYNMVFWPRGQYIICKFTPESIYHGGQNTIWHRVWDKINNLPYSSYAHLSLYHGYSY